jgi:hypothetical protein
MSAALDTGTGATRRRLTLEEAQRGDKPTPFTAEEWRVLHIVAAMETDLKHYRLALKAMRVHL